MDGFENVSWCSSKMTVEECRELDINRFVRAGMIAPLQIGTVTWRDQHTGKVVASIDFLTKPVGDSLELLLKYRLQRQENVNLPIRLQTTVPHFGGSRWWFTCPLLNDGLPCRRRVGKLYLRGKFFGCRHCHDLTYRSCQEAHQTERIFAKLGIPADRELLSQFRSRFG